MPCKGLGNMGMGLLTNRYAMNAAKSATGRQRHVTDMQRTTLLCFLLLAIWLFAHPWEGIRHDAQFYALQALSHFRPEAYRSDLFFFAASQDDFTLFSPIYAALISLLGLNAAAITLLIAGYVLWIGSAAWLLRRLLHGFPLWLGLALLFAMPRGYGGYGDQLRFAEPFLTPRLIAEGLTLLSLAMVLRGKPLAALAAMAAAFSMHPLMALAGAGFVGFYLAQERPKATLGAAVPALALLFGLAYLDAAPFDRLLATMDSQWFELVFARSPFVFWDGWRPENWLNRVLLSFSLLATAGIAAQDTHRRAFLAALLVGCTSLLLTWLGTSLFHHVLLIQIQPWRALWLVQLFSYIAAAWLVAQFWRRGQVYRLLLLCFLTASLTLGTVGGLLALLAASLFVWQVRTGQEIHLSKTSIKMLYLFPLLIATVWLASSWLVAATELTSAASPFENFVYFTLSWIRALLAGGGSGVITLALLLAVWHYGPDQRKFVHLGAVAGVLFLLFLSIAIWYRPNQQEHYYEQWALQNPIPSFARHIPVDAVVYWENNPKMTWFALARANYASKLQTAGIIFSRQTAIEGKRRLDRLAALGLADSIFDWEGNAPRLPTASLEGLVHVCHDHVLDYVILSKDFGAGVIERHAEKVTGEHFYLYDCAYLRGNVIDTWAGNENERPATARFSLPTKP